MPESMRMHTGDAGSEANAANPSLELVSADSLFLSAENERRFLGISKKARPRLAGVDDRRIERLPRDGRAPYRIAVTTLHLFHRACASISS